MTESSYVEHSPIDTTRVNRKLADYLNHQTPMTKLSALLTSDKDISSPSSLVSFKNNKVELDHPVQHKGVDDIPEPVAKHELDSNVSEE